MTWYYVPYTYAADTAASSLPCEDTPAPWLTLSGTPTQRPLSWRGWQRRGWIKLLSGLTSPPLMLHRGVEQWISSQRGSPVSPSPLPVSGWALTMTVGSGPKSQGSFAKWHPLTSCWKTSQELFARVLPMSSVTLPNTGSMRSGVCTPRPTLAPLTDGSGSGLWPTSRASDGMAVNAHSRADFSPTLPQLVRGWPTPQASDYVQDSPADRRRNSPPLPSIAAMWPTPRASMNENRTTKDAPSHGNGHGRTLAGTASHHDPTTSTDGSNGMVLNPAFVAALMGLPNGWLTPCTSAVTDSSHSAPALHGNSSLHDLEITK